MHGSGYSFLPTTLKPIPSNPVMFDVAFQNDSIVDAKRAKLPMCHFLV
jgi:hypothetical protein